jgi:hypothetical protein
MPIDRPFGARFRFGIARHSTHPGSLGSLDHGPCRGGHGPVAGEEDQVEPQLHEDDGLAAAGLATA